MLNVAFDLCRHATPLTAYRCLMEEILPTAQIHPNLAETDIIQHYTHTIELAISYQTFLKRKIEDHRWGEEPDWYIQHIWESHLQVPKWGKIDLHLSGENPFEIFDILRNLKILV